jgi:hypothetical protein
VLPQGSDEPLQGTFPDQFLHVYFSIFRQGLKRLFLKKCQGLLLVSGNGPLGTTTIFRFRRVIAAGETSALNLWRQASLGSAGFPPVPHRQDAAVPARGAAGRQSHAPLRQCKPEFRGRRSGEKPISAPESRLTTNELMMYRGRNAATEAVAPGNTKSRHLNRATKAPSGPMQTGLSWLFFGGCP